MTSPSPGVNRIKADVLKLIDSKHEVTVLNNINEFVVRFDGPQNTPYAGGVWRVRVDLPEKYPFKSPSIGFTNRIFHPNIDEISGTVCLDVINQTWSPMYDLTNVFETFLPQLLAYPNPSDPLNGDAAALFIHRPEEFKRTVREYVRKYASDGSTPVEDLPMVPDLSELLPISHTNGHHSGSSPEIETSITHAVSEVSSMPSSEVAAPADSISDDDDDEDVFEADVLETFPCPPPVRIDLITTPRSSRPVHSPVPTTGIVQAPERIARSFRGARRNLERIISRHQTIMQRTLSADVGESHHHHQHQWPQPSCSNGDSNNRITSSRRWTIVVDDDEEERKKAAGSATAAQSEAETTETKKRRRCITLPCSLENISDESDMSDFDDSHV